MALATVSLEIDQGADWWHEWKWSLEDDNGVQTPVNLTGYTARMEIRPKAASGTLLARAHSTLSTDGTITVDALGVVRVEFTAAVSSEWRWTSGVYDLELVSPGDEVTRLVEGSVTVRPEVTRGS